MNGTTDISEAVVGDDELIAGLDRALHESQGTRQVIRRLVRQASSYQSTYPLEELTVVFEDGDHLDLIFKNVSPRALSPTARRAKPDFLYDPRREISVYRTILGTAELGTPRYYGSLIDDDQNRYWLFLEKVAGRELYQIGEMTLWLSAARWLARFHERFACLDTLPRLTARSLTRFDAQYYQQWFDRAVRFARECNAVLRSIAPRTHTLPPPIGRPMARLVLQLDAPQRASP